LSLKKWQKTLFRNLSQLFFFSAKFCTHEKRKEKKLFLVFWEKKLPNFIIYNFENSHHILTQILVSGHFF